MIVSRKHYLIHPAHPPEVRVAPIERVFEYKYLGVCLSHNFKLEVSYSIYRYPRRQEKRQELFIEDSAQLYLSFVRPHLKYTSPVWDPYCSSHEDILENICSTYLL